MPLKPEIGSSGGQHYDVARAIQTFLHQMAEGGASVASAVIKELLQNADDARATEVTVILDERNPAEGFFPEYGSLFAPALLVRNNAPFRLPKEMGQDELDDFTAICDVASGHKRAQATAAGRFGIGFNSVYFLTDTPILFSRREVHVFDLLHRVFEANGWRFPLEAFPATAISSAGPVKVALEWILPKAALGETRSFGELAADSAGDYRQALLRIPLRKTPEGEKSLYEDRFPDTKDRWRVLREMSEQAARSVLFLKHIQSIWFGVLREGQVDKVGWVKVTPNPPDFYRFLKSVQELARNFDLGERVSCAFDRKVQYRRLPDGNALPERDVEVTWSFHVKHWARFDDQDLTELRKRLDRNEERAVPWAALAIPRDPASMRFDGDEVPAWRVFLPLREPGPSGCVYSAALFVGPSRQHPEFRTDGSDEARRKTEWNQRLVERALVPLLQDASMDMLDLLPDLIMKHPKDYLSLFPVASAPQGHAGSLTEHFRRCFSSESWYLRLHDIWGQEIELPVGDKNASLSLEMVPDWLAAYRDRFKDLSNVTRRFIRYALGDALRARLDEATSDLVHRSVTSDVPRVVLAHEEPPEAEDLARLLRLLAPEEGISKGSIHDLWGLGHADDGSLLRYDRDVLYILHDPKAATGVHHALQSLGLRFERTEWVDPRIGLASMSLQERRSVDNLVSADEGAALELLRRVGGGNQHDVVSHAYAIKPVVEFLCSLDPSRRPGDLRLGFLIRTAQYELDRRPLGTILLKPEDPSVEDTALWDGLFRRTFAKVAPEFARELYPLLRRWPSCLDMMHAPGCRVAVARASNALEMLHHARISFPASYDRIGEEMNRSGAGANDSHRAAAERSAALLLEHADRSWANLDASQQLSVLALPIHRCADGRFVPLTDVSGSDLSLLNSRFRIQSDDDIQDAPIQVPECMLLQSVDPLIKRFYRRQLGLEEHGRAVVLKAVLRQIGTPGAPNIQLLRYLVRYYRETVERLAASIDMLQKEDAQELRRLSESAKTVPCTDGEWRPARYCPEVWETAEERCLIPWMY